MKRWHETEMLIQGNKLFEKTKKRKVAVNANHEIHLLAREVDDWLPEGIQALKTGNYWPRYLKRQFFSDEVVDVLHITDRIFQNLLLKQLKPTLPHIVNPNCLHIHGPHGVKRATGQIREALDSKVV